MDTGALGFMGEVVKSVGVAGLIFVVWYVYHQSVMRSLQSVIEEQRRKDEQHFEILKGFVDTLQYQGACLARMENKIDTNAFCPLTRKEVKG